MKKPSATQPFNSLQPIGISRIKSAIFACLFLFAASSHACRIICFPLLTEYPQCFEFEGDCPASGDYPCQQLRVVVGTAEGTIELQPNGVATVKRGKKKNLLAGDKLAAFQQSVEQKYPKDKRTSAEKMEQLKAEYSKFFKSYRYTEDPVSEGRLKKFASESGLPIVRTK